MKIEEDVTLAPYTTFKIGGPARFFCSVKSEDDIIRAVSFAHDENIPILIIGGGSNLLISDAGFDGLVIHVEIIGKNFIDNDSGSTIIEVGAGEYLEDLAGECVDRGLFGIENLSSIPGKVGAAPVQNIGAYGAEVSNSIRSIRALDTRRMEFVELSNSDCAFTYRDSLFKHEKGRYIISNVRFELSRNGKVNIEYKDLKEYFSKRNISTPSLKEVREAVIDIRKNKLPDWTKWGTAGSFFKNPIISPDDFKRLKQRYPELPGFREPDGSMKVPLGWILDKVCDVKGLVIGNVGTYDRQAMVIVAKPGATATEVIDLANRLMKCVMEKTGIKIEAEVEWVV